MKEIKNPYAGKKKAVGIHLSPEVVDYFKGLAEETGLPYQKLVDLYLLDCAKKRKKLITKGLAAQCPTAFRHRRLSCGFHAKHQSRFATLRV